MHNRYNLGQLARGSAAARGNDGDRRTYGLGRSGLLAHDILEIGDRRIPLRKLVRRQEGNHAFANRTAILGYLGKYLFSGYTWVLLFVLKYFFAGFHQSGLHLFLLL